jgi:hypothetical protein
MFIEGSCHCGNISYRLDWAGDPDAIPARACACTFCRKHGNVWTAHAGSSLQLSLRDAALVSRYRFGTGTAVFHVCARCGAVPAATSEIDGRLYAVVNVNTFEGVDPARLQPTSVDFEGEASNARLARRQRHWIAEVNVDAGVAS